MLMLSSSSTPADLAMEVIKGDEIKKVAPLIPLAVGAGFGAYGAARGAGMRGLDAWGDDDPNTKFFDFEDTARYEDPLTGGLIMGEHGKYNPGGIGEIEDANIAQRAGGAVVGATQALNPFSYLKLGGRVGAAGVRSGGRGVSSLGGKLPAGGRVAARNERLAHEAGAEAAEKYRYAYPGLYESEAEAAALGFKPTFGQKVGGLPAAGYDKVVGAPGRTLTRWGDDMQQVGTRPLSETHPWYNRIGSVAGRGLQISPEVMALLAGAGAVSAMGEGNVDIAQATGGGYGATPSAQGGYGTGGLDYNMGDVGQGYSQGTPEQAIWTGEMEQQRGSGYGHQPQQIKTGENMKIGQQLLKEAKEDMDKPKDDKDAKGKKGGMILIIGHGGKPPKGDDKSKDDTE